MKTIGVVTVARSDYGLYRPLLQRIQRRRDLTLALYVGGAHLSPEFGHTIKDIEGDGFSIVERVEMTLSSDTPEGISKSMGLGIIGFAQAFARSRPDLLVVLGDRFDMHAAALAALPFNIPVAHIHGGELTEGVIDDALRHSMTKLSHLHFVSTEEHGRRVKQMGEEPWRIVVSGAPGLDNLARVRPRRRVALEKFLKLDFRVRPLLVTFHPVTLFYKKASSQVLELLTALSRCQRPIVFTSPSADTAGQEVLKALRGFVEKCPRARLIPHLGTAAYFGMMANAAAMVGNSSSGILEAASFGLPVVNVGSRQAGRFQPANVIQVDCDRHSIAQGIRTALSSSFRKTLRGLVNPYGDGHAAGRILDVLSSVPLNERLLRKKFTDVRPL